MRKITSEDIIGIILSYWALSSRYRTYMTVLFEKWGNIFIEFNSGKYFSIRVDFPRKVLLVNYEKADDFYALLKYLGEEGEKYIVPILQLKVNGRYKMEIQMEADIHKVYEDIITQFNGQIIHKHSHHNDYYKEVMRKINREETINNIIDAKD